LKDNSGWISSTKIFGERVNLKELHSSVQGNRKEKGKLSVPHTYDDGSAASSGLPM
jgi:hypothetical protein